MTNALYPFEWITLAPIAQSQGAGSDSSSPLILVLILLLVVALLVALVAILRGLAERRRLRSGIRLLGQAASQLANEREYSIVGLGGDPDLATAGEAFNRISRMHSEAAGKRGCEAAADAQLAGQIEGYQAAWGEIFQSTRGGDLHRTLLRALVEHFGYPAAVLWLLHPYVKRERKSEPAEGGIDVQSETQNVLDRVGLLPAGRLGPIDGTSDDGLPRYPYGGVLEAAMTGEPVICNDLKESPIFENVAGVLAGSGLRSYAAVPLESAGRVIGVIEAFGADALSPVNQRFLDTFAAGAASLIRLMHQSEEAAQSREAYESQNIELQMANRQLQRTNSQLAEADRLKGEFLANTSHELRTPLNSILGFAQLILAGACDTEEEMRSNVEAIHESGERLLKLINEVLDLAKIEAGRLNLSLAPVDVRPVIDAAHTLMKVQAEAKGIALKVETPPGELSPVRADHSKLYQILVNLVGNAVKFTESGSVTVKIVPESIPGFMVIRVEDTGIGIAPDVLSRLFQKFVQGDGSVTRKFGGTGLGLAISQKMADLQGGSLTLSSSGEGKGAVASLVLPLWSDRLETEVTRHSIRPLPGEFPSSRTVVLIEDYLEFQRYLAELLESRGWHVLTARTAREGLELIQGYVPAAVVLDIHLPWDEEDATVRSGYDIVRILGRDDDLNVIPILIVTGMVREAADRLLTQTVINPVEIYGKPLNEQAFLEALGRMTASEHHVSTPGS
jgi:signal transduction histidine kinase/CheY-like chemotaxis protein